MAVLVTVRKSDQRKASTTSAWSAARGGSPAQKRAIGVCPVSLCTRQLSTDSAQARKRSLSSSRSAMPAASASSRKRSRMTRFSRSCLPRPCG